MNRYEYIKSLTAEEMAEELCEFISQLDVECKKCPANEYCHRGHNGMKDWLMTEAEE